MTNGQKLKNLAVPTGPVDVVLDTDAYNEIDDQFAIAYLFGCKEKLNVKALYAAPFHNSNSSGAKDGMERSYNEILKLLDFMGESAEAYRGSETYLPNETTPVPSPAADDLVARARLYSPEKPLYVVAIGAITNVASALLIDPSIAENIVLVWLGGHAYHYHHTKEFNMYQDVAASRVVMASGAPFIQLPCFGVVSAFTLSEPELDYWFKGKNRVATYLAENTVKAASSYAAGLAWTRVIWDVTAVAYLMNDKSRFMHARTVDTRLSDYNNQYEAPLEGMPMTYVYHINRDALLNDMIGRITGVFPKKTVNK